MLKKSILVCAAIIALTACASETPRIVQATTDMQEVRLTSGMATQIEMPGSSRVQSVTVGNPDLVTADRADNIVSLVPKDGSGETNLIVRAMDDSGRSQIYQYRIIVQKR
jgi:type IV secretory pathway VirB9-like protein